MDRNLSCWKCLQIVWEINNLDVRIIFMHFQGRRLIVSTNASHFSFELETSKSLLAYWFQLYALDCRQPMLQLNMVRRLFSIILFQNGMRTLTFQTMMGEALYTGISFFTMLQVVNVFMHQYGAYEYDLCLDIVYDILLSIGFYVSHPICFVVVI